VAGERLLVRPDLDPAKTRGQLIEAVRDFAETRNLSSVHGLFVSEADRQAFEVADWLPRRDVQFHWTNHGYTSFDHYLESFTADKRKKAKRERRRVIEDGITFDTLRGTQIDRAIADEAYELHRGTFLQHHNEPYLTRACFRALPAALGDDFLIKRARQQGETVAMAVFFRGGDALYGRYWGAYEQHHSLHFETCYYQALEFCIEQRISLFEGGAQGEHKLFRGLLPVETHSAHWLAHPAFADAIEDYLKREGAGIARYVDELKEHSPFRTPSPSS